MNDAGDKPSNCLERPVDNGEKFRMPGIGFSGPPDRFEETHWSLIVAARGSDDAAATAWNKLCSNYRLPLYSFVRHRGFSPADSEDLIQAFFLDLFEREALLRVDRQRGRFRSFLLAALRNFLANEWDRQRTRKRGGGFRFVSLDEPEVEALYSGMSAGQTDAEKLFDRAWAVSILNRALNHVKEEYQAEGRAPLFESLEGILSDDTAIISYADVALKLGCSPAAVRMAAMRLRRRFGELLRKQVLTTVADSSEVEDELRYLISCL